MARHIEQLGGNTFAFFTRNPRGGAAKEIDTQDLQRFACFCREKDIDQLVAHAPYTLNPCAQKESVRNFALSAFQDDLRRMENTPGQYYNFHPGSHVGQGPETGMEKTAQLLNQVLFPDMTTTVLLETMAGKGTEIAVSFEQIRNILDQVELTEKLGVCLDTCHVWDAGYDIVHHLDEVLSQFDQIIGLNRLKAVHLNNSRNDLGSHKDRHARLTEGHIPLEAIRRLVNHPALENLPFILETPCDDAGYAEEIALVRSLRAGN